ncbi:hypothetical protein [Asticcacaulis sp. AC402]|uniref:hypothetical protein n=1 Tax=Asticcacaulis sp. AC402 TaxID=1282361 RepID=UPI0003C3F4D7|nr:hypothetical protein [Asticcacaulis sp. AC402]ESQ74590.1 hypothetical protein ABAC402_13175 [Asticcacaulis sp. AC402]
MSDFKRHGLVMVGILVTVVAVRILFPTAFDGVGNGLVTGLHDFKAWVRGG